MKPNENKEEMSLDKMSANLTNAEENHFFKSEKTDEKMAKTKITSVTLDVAKRKEGIPREQKRAYDHV